MEGVLILAIGACVSADVAVVLLAPARAVTAALPAR
jgi:hypothetical protein